MVQLKQQKNLVTDGLKLKKKQKKNMNKWLLRIEQDMTQ